MSAYRVMPRDHISDIGGRVWCGGTGSDSGDLHSRWCEHVSEELTRGKVEGTDVLVLLLLTGVCIMRT